MNIDPKNVLIALLLGLFLWSVVDGSAMAGQGRFDGGGGDDDKGLIAVTGQFGSGASALYLIDSRTRHMSVYRVDGAGDKLELVAARDCTYDFYLQSYQDKSEPAYLPANLRRSWKKYGGKDVPGGTTPGAEEGEDPRGGGKPRKVGPTVKPIGGGGD